MIYLNEGHLGEIWISEEYVRHEICEKCFGLNECAGFETLESLLVYAIRRYGKNYVKNQLGCEVEVPYRNVESRSTHRFKRRL